MDREIDDPSQFTSERIVEDEAMHRVLDIVYGVPVVPATYTMKNPLKEVCKIFRLNLVDCFSLLCHMLICKLLLQDDVNVYRSSPPLPKIACPTHLLPSAHNPLLQQWQQRAIESVDSMVVPDSDLSSSYADIEKDSGAGGGVVNARGIW